MTREIKFRALRKGQHFKGWFYFSVIEGTRGEDVDEGTICQYTGLQDKNSKEIYEGDIVKGETWKEPYAMKTKTETIGQVKYIENHGYMFSGKLPDGFRTYPNLRSCEVVGNVYENKELLEQ